MAILWMNLNLIEVLKFLLTYYTVVWEALMTAISKHKQQKR